MSIIPLQLTNREKNILVSGATGMLGRALVKELNKNSNYRIFCVSKSNSVPFDFVKLISFEEIGDLEFEAFFHCAAEVNVSFCEKDLNHAIQSNCEYAKMLFERVKANCNFLISTDSVYEGTRGDYKEIDEAQPVNNYAMSKLKGEEASLKIVENLYIIRTNIIGNNSKNKRSLFEWANKELNFSNPINGFNNIYFNPLSVQHLSIILLKIIEEKVPFGIYNLGCDEKFSKYDFLVEVANLIEADPGLINSVEYNPTSEDVRRPMNTTMDCSKIKQYIKYLDLSFQTTLKLLKTSINEKN